MSAFTELILIGQVEGTRKTYISLEDICWEIGKEGSGYKLVIEEYTPFDISVPRCLEWAQSPHDRRLLPAAAIHDELLKRGFDKAFASAEFRRAAIARGINPAWAWILFILTLIWTSLPNWLTNPLARL